MKMSTTFRVALTVLAFSEIDLSAGTVCRRFTLMTLSESMCSTSVFLMSVLRNGDDIWCTYCTFLNTLIFLRL